MSNSPSRSSGIPGDMTVSTVSHSKTCIFDVTIDLYVEYTCACLDRRVNYLK